MTDPNVESTSEQGQDGLYELSPEEIEQIAALVYQLVRDELRLERERSG